MAAECEMWLEAKKAAAIEARMRAYAAELADAGIPDDEANVRLAAFQDRMMAEGPWG